MSFTGLMFLYQEVGDVAALIEQDEAAIQNERRVGDWTLCESVDMNAWRGPEQLLRALVNNSRQPAIVSLVVSSDVALVLGMGVRSGRWGAAIPWESAVEIAAAEGVCLDDAAAVVEPAEAERRALAWSAEAGLIANRGRNQVDPE